MLLVPELTAIFIFPPRTGSDSLCIELMRKFPNAFLPYRHAEADLVPEGYDNWRKIGFVRHPLARLWSLYKYCAILADHENIMPQLKDEVDRVANSVQGMQFEDWVRNNTELFLPKDSPYPLLYQRHHIPETRKSQEIYLCPDLGTIILRYQDLPKHMLSWGLDPAKKNGATPPVPCPKPSKALQKHMKKYFAWDMAFPDLEVL